MRYVVRTRCRLKLELHVVFHSLIRVSSKKAFVQAIYYAFLCTFLTSFPKIEVLLVTFLFSFLWLPIKSSFSFLSQIKRKFNNFVGSTAVFLLFFWYFLSCLRFVRYSLSLLPNRTGKKKKAEIKRLTQENSRTITTKSKCILIIITLYLTPKTRLFNNKPISRSKESKLRFFRNRSQKKNNENQSINRIKS